MPAKPSHRARLEDQYEPETLFGSKGWQTERPRDNRFDPVELAPRGRAYVIREEEGRRGLDVTGWDALGGQAARPSRGPGR